MKLDEITEEQYVEWIKGQIKNYVDSRGKHKKLTTKRR